jgi:glyoxylase-like metal-dependent hydrolase (beta-lactamase superfamily II)
MKTRNEFPNVTAAPLPTPYPVGDVNAYLIESDELTLLDTGVFWDKSLAALSAALASLGRKIEDLDNVVVTHHHFDHFGAAFHLSGLSGARVFYHESVPFFIRRSAEQEDYVQSFLGRCGYSKDYLLLGRELVRKGKRFGALDAAHAETIELKDGDELNLGGFTLRAVFSPGHSPDHLCYYNQSQGLLFSGDFLLPRITPNPLLYFDFSGAKPKRIKSLLNYLSSLSKVGALDAKKALPGHGAEIESPCETIEKNLRFIRERAARFESGLTDAPSSLFDLSVAVFGERDPMNAYLALSETIAYVDLLEAEGKAEPDWDGEVVAVAKARR